MADFKTDKIKELLADVRFSPIRVKLEMLEKAESLYFLLDSGKQYPYEFVCSKITGYNPGGEGEIEILEGSSVQADVRLFVLELSKTVSQPAAMLNHPAYSIASLSEMLGVSDKTIRRWKRFGLIVRYLVFEDGIKKLAITQQAFEHFKKQNPEIITKASNFNRLSEEERKQILELSKQLKEKRPEIARSKAAELISEKMHRSFETIRSSLQNAEQSEQSNIYLPRKGRVNSKIQKQISELYAGGESVGDICKMLGCSRSSVYRAINRSKAKRIEAVELGFVDSPDFQKPAQMKKIEEKKIFLPSHVEVSTSPDDVNRYISRINRIKPATRDHELEMFKKYNCLKKLHQQEKKTLNLSSPSGKKLQKMQSRLEEIGRIKHAVFQSNLRVVINIAAKHIGKHISFAELISEGNMALFRAIEGYDYTKGFRFSTYAGWAVVRSFARITPSDSLPLEDSMHTDMRNVDVSSVPVVEQAGRDLDEVISANLDPKEQFVVKSHYGLDDPSLIKKKKKTLKQIGKELGVSQETARQIELKALQKLRHCLSVDMFDKLLK
ncbi:RNA polymerase sigma factor RpoD [Sedimentisphaera cyanobacteriorum]|uniref:RNA polymerase sigma factor RpoD n=1 Tax=Sedimentisphaera cyanobacteriorum TaxID=1940790 RepID=A0A1Q2HR04_9BACT|nr:sigma-70 family RNA polymerase sigma factor [Sedimentisphaera cyanobacteriorum]AQQ09888.1 RNA polymerase sigma factor RpoD [Sedimentisphaera cyanobacteriorum]